MNCQEPLTSREGAQHGGLEVGWAIKPIDRGRPTVETLLNRAPKRRRFNSNHPVLGFPASFAFAQLFASMCKLFASRDRMIDS
jgi:hypothetical protein